MEMQIHQQENLNTSGPWKLPLKDNECPHKPKTAKALLWALIRLGIDVRHNLRRHAAEYRIDSVVWLGMNGRAVARITSEIEDAFVIRGYRDTIMPLKFGREAFKDCLDSLLFDMEVDPFVE